MHAQRRTQTSEATLDGRFTFPVTTPMVNRLAAALSALATRTTGA